MLLITDFTILNFNFHLNFSLFIGFFKQAVGTLASKQQSKSSIEIFCQLESIKSFLLRQIQKYFLYLLCSFIPHFSYKRFHSRIDFRTKKEECAEKWSQRCNSKSTFNIPESDWKWIGFNNVLNKYIIIIMSPIPNEKNHSNSFILFHIFFFSF